MKERRKIWGNKASSSFAKARSRSLVIFAPSRAYCVLNQSVPFARLSIYITVKIADALPAVSLLSAVYKPQPTCSRILSCRRDHFDTGNEIFAVRQMAHLAVSPRFVAFSLTYSQLRGNGPLVST